MAVIILILKIIGIVLLVLLGLLVLVLGAVLFVPVRYRITGRQTAGADPPELSARADWLLHLVSYRFAYRGGETESGLRICGRFRKKKAPGEPDSWEEPGEPEPDQTEAAVTKEKPGRKNPAEETNTEPNEAKAAGESRQKETHAGPEAPTGQEGLPERAQPEEKTQSRPAEAIKRLLVFAVGLPKRIRLAVSGAAAAIRRLKEAAAQALSKIAEIKAAVTDETNRTAVRGIVRELRFLLSHFRVRKIDADLSFSLGDPAATGQALGLISVLPVVYRYRFRIYPDFDSEEMYLLGEFDIRGKARMIHLLRSAIRLYRQKEFRIFIKRIMNR